jgi:cyclophilin family peptidyl-prolyl cis-trans isomerase
LLVAFRLVGADLPDGLYAKFTTTKGDITAKLYFEQTPRTVAHFVALAEGTQPFIDFAHPSVAKRPFYDGLTFHRVIKGFVIQSGSPNGLGTDGPGYTIANEIQPALTHNRAGMLGAARTSQQDTYGAQFYFTLTNTPALDGQYTVWGETVEGLDVVLAIGDVPTGANDKPVAPVVIEKVEILRLGAAALAFDPAKVTPSLPEPRTKALTMEVGTNSLNFTWQTNANASYRILYSPSLRTWSDTGLFRNDNIPGSNLYTNNPAFFFRLFEVQF